MLSFQKEIQVICTNKTSSKSLFSGLFFLAGFLLILFLIVFFNVVFNFVACGSVSYELRDPGEVI